jgi:hypothetical protein
VLEIKLALTDCAWVIATVQLSAVPKLAQAPPQPENTEPEAAAGVRATTVPLS